MNEDNEEEGKKTIVILNMKKNPNELTKNPSMNSKKNFN